MMVSLVASDLYRLVRDRRLWLAVGLVAVVVAVGAWGGWLVVATDGAINPGSSYDLVVTRTNMYASSNPVPVVACCVLAAALAAENRETGFEKSLHAPLGARANTRVARLVSVGVACALAWAAALLAAEASYGLLGFSVVGEEAGRVAAYCVLLLLQTFAYAALTAALTWALRSKAAGVVCAVLVGGGFVGSVVQMGLVAMSATVPAAAELALWLPSWAGAQKLFVLGADALFSAAPAGGLAAPLRAALASGLWAAAACAASAIMGARRADVA